MARAYVVYGGHKQQMIGRIEVIPVLNFLKLDWWAQKNP